MALTSLYTSEMGRAFFAVAVTVADEDVVVSVDAATDTAVAAAVNTTACWLDLL